MKIGSANHISIDCTGNKEDYCHKIIIFQYFQCKAKSELGHCWWIIIRLDRIVANFEEFVLFFCKLEYYNCLGYSELEYLRQVLGTFLANCCAVEHVCTTFHTYYRYTSI